MSRKGFVSLLISSSEAAIVVSQNLAATLHKNGLSLRVALWTIANLAIESKKTDFETL